MQLVIDFLIETLTRILGALYWGFQVLYSAFSVLVNLIVSCVAAFYYVVTEWWRVIGLAVTVVFYWWWNTLFTFVLDMFCKTIDWAAALVSDIPYDLSVVGEYLSIAGEIVYVINLFIPLTLFLSLIATYVTTAVSLFTVRHLIKVAPFIG